LKKKRTTNQLRANYKIDIDTSNKDELAKFFKDHEDHTLPELSSRYNIPIIRLRVWRNKLGISNKSRQIDGLRKLNGHEYMKLRKKTYRNYTKEEWDNPEFFKEMYTEKGYGIVILSKMTNTTERTIINRLHRFNIRINSYHEVSKSHNPFCNKKWLYDNYYMELKTLPEMGKEANVSKYTISNWLHKFGFRTRSVDEANYSSRLKKIKLANKLKPQQELVDGTSIS